MKTLVPAVARMGPPVRVLTCVPVAKISSAIRGRALFLNRAVVKPPMASASGAKVPIREPRISGTSINPPGIFCIVPKKGEREVSVDTIGVSRTIFLGCRRSCVRLSGG
jgi:hypothetical protein